MYKKVDFPIAEGFKGEREVEVAWIRRHLKGIVGKTIADFGCVNYGNYKNCSRWLGFDIYEVDINNTLLAFDKAEFSVLQDRYINADLMVAGFCRAQSVDIGISVSVIEHVGINSLPRVLAGDFIAIRNLYDIIKVNGCLLITVPAAIIAGYPAEDFRSYNPELLRAYMNGLYGSRVTYEYYRYIHPFWMVAYNDEDFESMMRVKISEDHYKGANSVACLRIEKR